MEEALMFDNEIDWVTGLKICRFRREAFGAAQDFKHVKYKAEHMQIELLQVGNLRQVFK